MANYFESFVRGQQAGQQAKQYQQQQEDRNAFRSLSSQILAGDPGAFSQAAAIDPAAATAVQTAGDSQTRRLKGALDYFDKARQSQNPQAVQAAFRTISPYMQQLTGNPAPEAYDEATMGPAFEQLRAKVAMLPADSTGDPAGWRQFQLTADAAGLKPGTPEYQQAARIALGQEGRASSAGYGFFEFEGADGRKRMGRNNPRTGAREVYDEITGTFTQLGPAGFAAPEAGAVSAPSTNYAEVFANLPMEFPGVVMTSGTRTRERNDQVDGKPNSRHLTGEAADYRVPAALKPAFIARASQFGLRAIDEGDHIHVQSTGPRGGMPAAGLVVGRTPEEEAAAKRAAEKEVDLRYAPGMAAVEAEAARQKAEAEAEAKRSVTQQERDATYQLYDTAITQLKSGFDGAITFPGMALMPGLTAQQQIAQGGVSAMAPVLKQIFRVAGEGTFTDRDQALLLEMLPTRNDLPAARQAKLDAVDAIVRAKLQQGAPSPARQGGERRARNPQTGEVLVLMNGQWVPENGR